MAVISEAYREMNAQLHAERPTYGAGGHRWADEVIRHAGTHDVLDYGCGKGTLQQALGFVISEYDPAIPGKDGEPEPAGFVVCTDVLEHIEPEQLTAVLADLRRVTRYRGLFVIATRPANKTLPDGRNAHLIQESTAWWLGQLVKAGFEVVEIAEDVKQAGEFMVVVE